MKVVTDAAIRESVLNSSAFIVAMGWIEASKVNFNSINGEAFIREFEQTISAPSATVVMAFLESFSDARYCEHGERHRKASLA